MGRKTGKEHSVWAKAVTYNDMIYFSRRNPNSDWLKNAIANPIVKVEFNGKKLKIVKKQRNSVLLLVQSTTYCCFMACNVELRYQDR